MDEKEIKRIEKRPVGGMPILVVYPCGATQEGWLIDGQYGEEVFCSTKVIPAEEGGLPSDPDEREMWVDKIIKKNSYLWFKDWNNKDNR